ncbi:MAG: DUF6311 domain-containing protein [Opitutales bacterium]|jgi:hypothetical protein
MSWSKLKRLYSVTLPLLIAFLIGISVGGIYLRESLGKSPNDGYTFFGDRPLHVAGSNYFQQQPWQYPLFDMEGYRYPEGGSVIFTDGIPIVAALIKLTHPLHETLIDYFDWYLLLCFGLQSVAFVLLLRECNIRHWRGTMTGALFVVCSPILFYRFIHTALCSHFLILMALLLYHRSQRKGADSRGWFIQYCLLLVVGLLIHPYLFFMTGILFGATCLAALANGTLQIRRALVNGFVTGICLFGFMLLTGHLRMDFEMGSAVGFGKYSMNLLSPIWPQKSGLAWWTTPVLSPNGGQYEGYAWMGAGLILLCFTLILFKPRQLYSEIRKHFIFFIILILLFLFSLSHMVYAGDQHLFTIPLNDSVLNFLNTFRASGRFFWPIYYAILSGSIILVWKLFSNRIAVVVVASCLGLQVADMRIFISHPPSPEPANPRQLNEDTILETLIDSHDQIVLLPTWEHATVENYPTLARLYVLASRYNKPISSCQQGRAFNPRSFTEDRELYLGSKLRDDTLYILIPPIASEVEALSLDPTFIMTRMLNDMLILCSDFSILDEKHPDWESLLKKKKLPKYNIGTKIEPGRHRNHQYLSGLEPFGKWTIEKQVLLTLHIPKQQANLDLYLNSNPFVSAVAPSQDVRFFVDDELIGTATFQIGEKMPWEVLTQLPEDAIDENGLLKVRMELPKASSPQNSGQSDDPRTLGLFINSFGVIPRNDAPLPVLQENQQISFAQKGSGNRYTQTGFSEPESDGIWTIGKLAKLAFYINKTKPGKTCFLKIDVSSFVNDLHPELRCRAWVNERVVSTLTFTQLDPNQMITIPLKQENGPVSVTLEMENPVSPLSLGISADPRNLGLYLRDMRLVQE